MTGDEHINEQEEEFKVVCEWCDKEFEAKNSDLMYCSKRCFEFEKADFNGEL